MTKKLITDEEKLLLMPKYLKYIEAINILKQKRDKDIQNVISGVMPDADKLVEISRLKDAYKKKRTVLYKTMYYVHTSNYKNYLKASEHKIKETHRAYYKNNKEDLLNRSKKYYENNKEVALEYANKYYENNKEEQNKKRAERDSRNRDSVNDKARENYNKNREDRNAKARARYANKKRIKQEE